MMKKNLTFITLGLLSFNAFANDSGTNETHALTEQVVETSSLQGAAEIQTSRITAFELLEKLTKLRREYQRLGVDTAKPMRNVLVIKEEYMKTLRELNTLLKNAKDMSVDEKKMLRSHRDAEAYVATKAYHRTGSTGLMPLIPESHLSKNNYRIQNKEQFGKYLSNNTIDKAIAEIIKKNPDLFKDIEAKMKSTLESMSIFELTRKDTLSRKLNGNIENDHRAWTPELAKEYLEVYVDEPK